MTNGRLIKKMDKKTKIDAMRETMAAYVIERDKLTVEQLRPLRDNLMIVEMASFPWTPEEYDEIHDYYTSLLVDGENILVVLKSLSHIVGYALAEPHNNEYGDEMLEADPLFEKKDNAYYIESVAVSPDFRKMGGFSQMLQVLLKEIAHRGGVVVTGHVRIKDGFNKYFAPFVKRRVDNWKFLHLESMDYFEMPIELGET